MKKENKYFENFRDWKRQFCQMAFLVFFLILCVSSIWWHVDVREFILKRFVDNNLKYDEIDISLRILIVAGLPVIFLVCFIVSLKRIRRSNKEETLNHGKFYHKHLYFSYWVCSKILGYKKCDLRNVPIYLQFK